MPRLSTKFLDSDKEPIIPVQLTEEMGQHHLFLIKCARAKGLNGLEAEEMVQDTWLTYLMIQERFRGESKLSTFLYGILNNKIREYFRRESRQSSLLQRYREESSWMLEDVFGGGAIEGEDERMASRQYLKIVSELLEDLPLLQKDVLLMSECSPLAKEEILEELGISDQNYRTGLCRSRKKLRSALKKSLGDECEGLSFA